MDGDGQLTGSAKKFDHELEVTVAKLRIRNASTQMGQSMSGPVHVMNIEVLFLETMIWFKVTAILAPEMDLPKFHALLADKFQLGVGWGFKSF